MSHSRTRIVALKGLEMTKGILWILVTLAFFIDDVVALKAVSKVEFDDQFAEEQSSDEEAKDMESPLPDQPNFFAPNTRSDAVKRKRSGPSDVVCNNNKCVMTFGMDGDGTGQKKISTDVRVTVLTSRDDDAKPKNPRDPKIDEDYEVPIFKGYAGVNPEDIKRDEPETTVPTPSITLEPPKFEARNWREYFDQKHRTTNGPGGYQKPRANGDRKFHPGFHPYTVGFVDRDEPNYIPSGWKPIARPSFPGDVYHYNSHGREDGFVGLNPQFVTYCHCDRKPLLKPFYNQDRDPWHYETTTKMPLDGKLTPPFKEDSKS